MTDEERMMLRESYTFMKSMKANATIPFEVQQAFRERFADLLGFSVSSTAANTHDQSVNEGGVGTYSVMGDPDLFIRVVSASGVSYDIPAFNV
ncbi:hypothetical protein C4568_03795 [Candidatus Parcubacteria bacterium]|nr:MAG: hypothetical protein C4568_03795 [Candidatus Parcubacteria bacterium]